MALDTPDSDFLVIHTPQALLDDFLGYGFGQETCITTGDIHREVLRLLEGVPAEVNRIFYALDPELIEPDCDGDFFREMRLYPNCYNDSGSEILTILRTSYQRLRAQVDDTLTFLGYEIFNPLNENDSTDLNDLTHNRFEKIERKWRLLAKKYNATAKLSRINFHTMEEGVRKLNESIKVFNQVPNHPNLADEKLFLSADSQFLVTVAANRKHSKTLCDALTKNFSNEGKLTLKHRLKAFLDAGSACEHLHEYGLIHGDFKPSNIFVEPEGDQYKGVLFDMEGVTLMGCGGHVLSRKTSNYFDEFYYKYPLSDQGDIDGASDVFAMALTLIDILFPHKNFSAQLFFLFRDMGSCQSQNEVEQKIMNLLDRYWTKDYCVNLKTCIKKALVAKREARPLCADFLNSLRKIFGNMD